MDVLADVAVDEGHGPLGKGKGLASFCKVRSVWGHFWPRGFQAHA